MKIIEHKELFYFELSHVGIFKSVLSSKKLVETGGNCLV